MAALTVMFGPSGSGKSHWVEHNCVGATQISSDEFFSRSGTYLWVKDQLEEAHNWCIRSFMEHMMLEPQPDLVIDNAFTSLMSAQPYMACGRAMGYRIRPVVMVPHDGWTRETIQIIQTRTTHGVPAGQIGVAAQNINRTLDQWPSYWPKPIRVDPFGPTGMNWPREAQYA